MPDSNEQPSEAELRVKYEGKLADKGSLNASEYASSIDGWRQLAQFSLDACRRSFDSLTDAPAGEQIQVTIEAEKRGSFLCVLCVRFLEHAQGTTGYSDSGATRAKAIARMPGLLFGLVRAHLDVRRSTTDIVEIAESLRVFVSENNLAFSRPEPTLFQIQAFDNFDIVAPITDPLRALAERIDTLIRLATRPLDASCSVLSVEDADRSSTLRIDENDRELLLVPLTAPPPKGDWQKGKVRFVRINNRTGRALFNFETEDPLTTSSHFGIIIDSAVTTPGNAYAVAFSNNSLLEVFYRQRSPERNRLNIFWELTSTKPADLLF